MRFIVEMHGKRVEGGAQVAFTQEFVTAAPTVEKAVKQAQAMGRNLGLRAGKAYPVNGVVKSEEEATHA